MSYLGKKCYPITRCTVTVRHFGLFLSAGRSFLFPNDVQEDLEYWAETGDLDDQELHEVLCPPNSDHQLELTARSRLIVCGVGFSQNVTG